MDLKNAGIAEDENLYDLIILGEGLQAALILLHAADKGLRAFLISENDCNENSNNEPFQLVEPILDIKIFKTRFRNNLIKSLKKSFSYLFSSSKIDNYQSLTFSKRLILSIHKYLFHQKIEIPSRGNKGNFPYFSFHAYKFSSTRMTMALLKKAVQLGAKIHSNSQIEKLDPLDGLIYQVQIIDKISNRAVNLRSKSILSFNLNSQMFRIDENKMGNKTIEIFYFTYPSGKLRLEKNRICRTKYHELKIITWFDYLYFEFSDSNYKNISLDDVILFIENNFTDIQIDKSEIMASGTYRKMLNFENKEKVQMVYLVNEKQTEFNYKPINQWFDYSNSICNLLIKHIKRGKEGKSPIGTIAFPGNDLPESDHPLRMMEIVDEKYDMAKQILKSPVYFKKLFYRYGSEIDLITNQAYENWNRTKSRSKAWLRAEIWYSIEHEFCKSPKDFIENRTEVWMENSQNNLEEIEQIFNELSV